MTRPSHPVNHGQHDQGNQQRDHDVQAAPGQSNEHRHGGDVQHPVANRPAKNNQIHDENGRKDCGGQQQQCPHVPADQDSARPGPRRPCETLPSAASSFAFPPKAFRPVPAKSIARIAGCSRPRKLLRMLRVPGGRTMRSRSMIPCSACRNAADPATAPSTTRIMGENARNMLNATACVNVMQLGKTRSTAR